MITYPHKQSIRDYIKELYRYRGLMVLLSKKSIKAKYEDSYIGMGWMIASPIITTIVYTLFFSIMFGVHAGNKLSYFLFIYTGMLPWIFFRDVFIETLDSFPKESLIVKRTYFPRLVIPLSIVITKMIQFSIGVIILFTIAILAGRNVSAHFYLFPILMLQIVLISLGMGLLFIIPCIIYRDIKHFIKFIVPLGLYSLPIFYNIRVVPANWLTYYTLNPMVSFVQCFRAILFKENIPWYLLGKGMVMAFIVFLIGCVIFRRYEKRLPDYI
jgi:lipopolysaccharide transport system permease protein